MTLEYEKAGGAYKSNKRTESQKSLKDWTDEAWTTSDGGPSKREGGKVRYLPKKVWETLGEADKKKANTTKRADDRAGKQFVANPEAAKKARAQAQKRTAKKKSVAGRDLCQPKTKLGFSLEMTLLHKCSFYAPH